MTYLRAGTNALIVPSRTFSCVRGLAMDYATVFISGMILGFGLRDPLMWAISWVWRLFGNECPNCWHNGFGYCICCGRDVRRQLFGRIDLSAVELKTIVCSNVYELEIATSYVPDDCLLAPSVAVITELRAGARSLRIDPPASYMLYRLRSACADTPSYDKGTWKDVERQLTEAGILD